MSTLNQLREGLNEAWDTLIDGWQRLYRRAAGAITRYTPGSKPKGLDDGVREREAAIRSTGWGVLAAEVFDDENAIVIRLEAPGLESEDFDIEVHERYLVVRGEKQMSHEHTEGRYHVTECAYGRFERAIPLPDDVQSDQAKASYKNGVLKVQLPKAKRRQRRIIQVETK